MKKTNYKQNRQVFAHFNQKATYENNIKLKQEASKSFTETLLGHMKKIFTRKSAK